MHIVVALVTFVVASTASAVFAQAPAAPPPVWTVAASGGLATTAGNADTSTFNLAYDLTYDPQTRNVIKSDSLFLRGTAQGDLASERLNFNVRDQYKLNDRAYVFGQNQFLRDKFKSITYLMAPTGGIGYSVISIPETKLDVDAGIGGVWEKNPGFDVRTSGAITAGEKFTQKLTGTTTFTQSVAALWKTKDFGDSLYTFGVGLAAAMSSRTQLKIELIDVYKNKPPSAKIKKNDIATLFAIVYKI